MPLKNKEYSKRAKFTPKLLKEFSEENGVECYFVSISDNIKIHRNSRVAGSCICENCNNSFETDFRSLIEKKLFYCKDCLRIISNKKREETCKEIYGVSNITKLPETKDKIKETCEKKYGGKSPAHSPEVKAKMKETNDKKTDEEKQEIHTKRLNTIKQTRGIDHFDFSKEALYKLCDEKGIKLLDNEGNETNGDFYENITRNDTIYFKCNYPGCEQECNKNYRQLKEVSGPLCKYHTTENMINKCKNTYKISTGYDHPMHNPYHYNIMIKKLQQTHNDPIKSIKIRERTKQTNLINNGVEYPMQSKKVQEKSKLTCLNKYSVEHPAQNSEIAEKSSKNAYKIKDYILPSGKIIKIQGYENYALDELLQNGILEENIITGCSNVPEIWYHDEDNKEHRHFVDIFIPNQNRCIEVKSTWTAEKKKDCIYLKQKAGKTLGYNYEIWVYNGKGKKIECYK